MHELYLWPFADAVKANVASVMCSYNKVNGTYACENDKALNGLLKGELNFQGESACLANYSNVRLRKLITNRLRDERLERAALH